MKIQASMEAAILKITWMYEDYWKLSSVSEMSVLNHFSCNMSKAKPYIYWYHSKYRSGIASYSKY